MALELILSQARRHYPHSLSPRLSYHFHRFLSSSPESPPDNPIPKPKTPIQVQPVSYKPKDPPQSQFQSQDSSESQARTTPQPVSYKPRDSPEPNASNAQDQTNPEARTWTRQDLRYLKNVPTISPVSYPTRVAPLPEDRIVAEGKGQEEGERKQTVDEELEREGRRIQNEQRFLAMSKIRGEAEMVPFPTFIKVENEKAEVKTIYDLKEAIRLAKVRLFHSFSI